MKDWDAPKVRDSFERREKLRANDGTDEAAEDSGEGDMFKQAGIAAE